MTPYKDQIKAAVSIVAWNEENFNTRLNALYFIRINIAMYRRIREATKRLSN